MNSNFNIFGLIFLLGSLQGVVLSFYLFFQTEKPRIRSVSLGFLILILAYDLFETTLSFSNHIPLFFQFLVLLFTFGMGPSLYLYVRSSLKPDENFPKKIWIYFLPIIIQILLRLVVFIAFLLDKSLGIWLYALHIRFSAPVSVLIFWTYLIWSWREYKTVRINEDLTQVEQIEIFSWIRLFLIVVTSITVLWTIMIFWSALFPNNFQFHYFFPFQIIIVLFIYWVGFKSFQRIKIIYVTAEKNSQAFFDSIPLDEVAECLEKLKKAMEIEKLYLDWELNLTGLAEKTTLKPKIISSVLNQKLGKGFNEFVNEYRVGEVKKKLLENDQNLNITEIAFASGFNSLPTFQRAFKAQTSVSPKEFITRHKKLK